MITTSIKQLKMAQLIGPHLAPSNLSCISIQEDWTVCASSVPGESIKEAPIDLIVSLVVANCWHILSRLRFLFYFVWPTETMFSSLDQVPRYVTEVS